MTKRVSRKSGPSDSQRRGKSKSALKVLFFSPHALADSSSGAARSVSTLLGELVGLGHQCMAVTGSVLDAANTLFDRVLAVPPAHEFKVSAANATMPIRKVMLRGVAHIIMNFSGTRVGDVLAVEELALQKLFLDCFAEFQPDVVLSYGGFTSNYFAGVYAMSQGRKSALYIGSGSYQRPEHFIHANMILTVSQSLCAQLDKVTQLPKLTIRPVVDKAAVVCRERKPEFITFINPLPAKGLKLAAALVLECQKRGRPYKFLFVEGRGTRETMRRVCPEIERLPTLSVARNTADIRQVFERTAIVLYPSVWYEAAGRVPLEANANGIPVLASNIGGIPEMLDGAGYLFDPPESCQKNWEAAVPSAYVERWLDVLDRLHNDPAELKDAERRACEADGRYDATKFAQDFVDFVAAG
ncbi:MAG: glycosyltransferase family 1 protein [Rhodospirillaceae bacterium]|nr:MAG: glycosyltransferase family 1 protein [Rhodospirillaceae bacterium]